MAGRTAIDRAVGDTVTGVSRRRRTYGQVVDREGNQIGRVADLKPGAAAFDIRVDTREIAELADLIEEAAKLVPAAVARALNRTVTETRTAVARALVKQTGAKYAVVRKALSTTPASVGHLSASIIARGGFMPLSAFKPKKTRKGVSAAPWGTRRVFPASFMVKKWGGNVYVRMGKPRFPIHKLYGPAIPRELPRDQSAATFHATVPVVLAKRLDHELGRILTK
ncbi:phage tail protein [Xanthobacteraceae bacterium Astr-EGSB]|uniref:phage tail protein n=1 Tax=Astrobacterium formosum TaxID=3069710 RepID=UPI0027B209F0|nr:phage tail protein [Xanthobacteraceae bacterium Astr-EGSB]